MERCFMANKGERVYDRVLWLLAGRADLCEAAGEGGELLLEGGGVVEKDTMEA